LFSIADMSVSSDTVIALCTTKIITKFIPDQTVLQRNYLNPTC
jgi:hypothetical protein